MAATMTATLSSDQPREKLQRMGSAALDEDELLSVIACTPREDNYVSDHFGGKFFTMKNARKIGYIRE